MTEAFCLTSFRDEKTFLQNMAILLREGRSFSYRGKDDHGYHVLEVTKDNFDFLRLESDRFDPEPIDELEIVDV